MNAPQNWLSFIKKSPLLTALMAVLGLMVGLAIVFAIFSWQTLRQISVGGGGQSATADVSTQLAAAQPQPFSVLLLGYGGGGHEGGLLTDTIIVARIDPVKEQITLITLPRDLWVSLPVNGETESGWKINAAYQIGSDDLSYPNKLAQFSGEAGGGNLAKLAVSQVVGFPIDAFVAVSFSGFTKSVDVLKGVEVEVEKTFDDYWYPLEGMEDETCGKSEEEIEALTATMSGYLLEQEFPCRYEHIHFDQGTVRMDGATALKFARSRHSAQDGSDFSRSQRQKNVILAMKDKVLRIDFLPKLIPFISTISQDLQTDLSLDNIQEFIKKKDEYQTYTIHSVALTEDNVLNHGRSQDGQYILIPREGAGNWDSIHKWLEQELTAKEEQISQEPSAIIPTE